MPQILYQLPRPAPPLGPTIGEEVRMADHWDDPALLRAFLLRQPEPTEVMEIDRVRARFRCVRARIRDLNTLRDSLLPRQSAAVDGELGKAMLMRKMLSWRMFRFAELPAELLAEIFRYVVLSINVMQGEPLQKLRLTWVCRQFREVALSDALLWGRIAFTDPSPWTRSLTFFQRAGDAPLDLCVSDMAFPRLPVLSHQQIVYLAEIFKTKVHNIRSLICSLKDWLGPWFAMEGGVNKLQLLQLDRGWEPYLWSTNQFNNVESRQPLALFGGHTPNLKSLTLNGISVDWDTISTAKLLTLDIRRLVRDVSPTAQHSTSTRRPQFEGQQAHDPIFVPNLRELRLGDANCQSAINILECIHAPELKGRFPKTQVLTIAAVQIENNAAAKEHITAWFDAMPRLRVLRTESLPTPILFKYLLGDPGRLVPMDLADIDRVNCLDLASFVKARDGHHVPLSVVTVPEPKWKQWTAEQRALLAFLGDRLQLLPNYPHHIVARRPPSVRNWTRP
ncbi:uncharacterized protein B0H18DRAFT_969857 [Fomitopsis serialis]|uniref:uncharacterized protein n=1 Tax=Fomitopsis serialis TaxID=139415 RepID=UPI0020074AAA|nr:uncharacterized protein B0H18DRAFT_969857 [Neoantrodia serialis]KAH9937271.1 hypothetical protein B0H18DRAFT_969857 [Neoantrodia serialis]